MDNVNLLEVTANNVVMAIRYRLDLALMEPQSNVIPFKGKEQLHARVLERNYESAQVNINYDY